MSLKKTIKKTVKGIIKSTDVGRRAFYVRELRRRELGKGHILPDKWHYLAAKLPSVHVYHGDNSGEAVAKLLSALPIEINSTDSFYYQLVPEFALEHSAPVFGNTTVNYEKIVKGSLKDLLLPEDSEFSRSNNAFIRAYMDYARRVASAASASSCPRGEQIAAALEGIVARPATHFYEAIQRVLFLNQLLWQTGHVLNGLGCLDRLLAPYYERDIGTGELTRETARALLLDFLRILHRHYEQKSNGLLGDTGQIILLGGSAEDGSYLTSELTYLFIDAVAELKKPDPKLLLKVNKNMPRALLQKAVECMATGIGSPLLANDDVIIPAMIAYGYEPADAYGYAVAACWEPLVPGKTCDQNNISSLNYAEPLTRVLASDFTSFAELKAAYKEELKHYVAAEAARFRHYEIAEDIVMSVFNDDCAKNRRDIAAGGARYNNVGFTGVGMGTVVNSLLNIERYVYEEQRYSLAELRAALAVDFDGFAEMLAVLKGNTAKYGRDEVHIIELTREIVDTINEVAINTRTASGARYKFGLSAPTYIDCGRDTVATPDGRRAGENFSPHISCADGIAYTELLSFAAALDYTGARFNGNVVDFMVTPRFLTANSDKFVLLLEQAIKLGFFEMQLNVIDSQTLIAARENPEKFPSLIVRVWGFSAYFNDLPDEYKDLLIERALKAEQAA